MCDLLFARVIAVDKLGGSQKCVCEGLTSLNWYFVENRDTLCIRSSVWFTTCTSNCREQNRRFSKVRVWGFDLSTVIFVENRDTLRIRSSVWFTTHTSNCRQPTWRFSKVRLWGFYLTELTFLYRIVTHSVLGVVCDLLRARMTAEKNAKVLRNACVCRESWHTPCQE